MSVEEKIEALYGQLNLAVSEYNLDDVKSIINELKKLGEENENFDIAINKIRNAKYPEDVEKFEDDMDIAIYEGDDEPMADRFLQRFKKEHPYCLAVSYWSFYLDVIYYSKYKTPAEYTLTKENKERDIVINAAKLYYLPKKDYFTAYKFLISADAYEEARAVQYQMAMELYDDKKYTDSFEAFKMARGYKDSERWIEKLHNIEEQHRKFKNEVPNDYIVKKIRTLHPDLLSKFDSLCYKSDSYVEYPGFFCLLCLLVSFVISILMHNDPELEQHVYYIIFTITTTIGVHKLFDIDYGKFSVIAIGAASLCLPKLLQLGSMKLFNIATPAFVLFNIVLAVAVGYCLVQGIRDSIIKSADKNLKKIRAKLDASINRVKRELINKYSSDVDKDLVKAWVDELSTSISR